LGTFRRVSVQLTTALAKLVSQEILQCEPEMFERTLSRLCTFALYDYAMPENPLDIKNSVIVPHEKKLVFVRQVEELTGRLTKIMRDTNQVREVEQKADQEKIADLYARIAKGYSATPELRATWLQALCKKHEEAKNYVEAAMCLVRVAAIIGLYLTRRDADLPLNLNLLENIAPSLNEIVDDEEGDLFLESDLIDVVKQAIENFEKVRQYCRIEIILDSVGFLAAVNDR
jgi:hypothetical protein